MGALISNGALSQRNNKWLSGMIAFFYAWFERHGCLLNQIVDFARAVRDDSVVSANSRDMDASRSGPIRDDSVIIANLRNMDASRKGVIRDDDCVLLTGS
jgi:hypothetical protein